MWTHTSQSNSTFGTFSGMCPERSKKVRIQERQNLNQLFYYPRQLKLMCFATSVASSHLTSGGVTTGIIFEQPGLKLSCSIWSFEDWVSEQIRKLLKDLSQVAIKSWQRIQLISKVPPKQSLNRKFLFWQKTEKLFGSFKICFQGINTRNWSFLKVIFSQNEGRVIFGRIGSSLGQSYQV